MNFSGMIDLCLPMMAFTMNFVCNTSCRKYRSTFVLKIFNFWALKSWFGRWKYQKLCSFLNKFLQNFGICTLYREFCTLYREWNYLTKCRKKSGLWVLFIICGCSLYRMYTIAGLHCSNKLVRITESYFTSLTSETFQSVRFVEWSF